MTTVPTTVRGGRVITRLVEWLLLLGGLTVAIVAAGDVLGSGALRGALLVLGLVAAYRGYRGVGRRAWGSEWDALYWLSMSWIVLVVLVAVLAPLLPLDGYKDTVLGLDNPSLATPNLFSAHPLGTDVSGLDLLSRVVYGARVSLLMAIVAALLGLVIGGFIGMVAGLWRGRTDGVVGLLNDSLLAFPPLVLLLAMAAVMPRNAFNIAIALGILAIPVNVRLSRANTLAIAEEKYVEASRVMGFSRLRVLFRDVMPNVVPALVTYALLLMALLLVAEASLSYLGLGVQLPLPSWGNMIAEGDDGRFARAPHIVMVPGAALFLSVLAFNIVGDRLRRKWDLNE